jgi:DNA-binding protein HU-beta
MSTGVNAGGGGAGIGRGGGDPTHRSSSDLGGLAPPSRPVAPAAKSGSKRSDAAAANAATATATAPAREKTKRAKTSTAAHETRGRPRTLAPAKLGNVLMTAETYCALLLRRGFTPLVSGERCPRVEGIAATATAAAKAATATAAAKAATATAAAKAAAGGGGAKERDGSEVRSIHWSPYDRVGEVDADP